MGCVFSRTEFDNPRVFHVWNVDSEGRHVKPGRIEISDSQLILYQKGNIVVKWPLRSLRRYGFDAELFSFECGRRCPTGPGVYAFKCRRAGVLFNILQENIQNSGGGGGGASSVVSVEDQISLAPSAGATSMNSPPPMIPNGGGDIVSSLSVDASGYLEPITATSVQQHYPSASSVQNTIRSNGGSPGGYVCIHGHNPDAVTVEWSTLPTCCSLGTCSRLSSSHNYANNEIIEQMSNGNCGVSQRCPNANGHGYVNDEVIDQATTGCSCTMHQYVNSSVIASDLTHRCCSPPKCYSDQRTQNTYVNSQVIAALSPGHLPCSSNCCAINCVDFNTNYAKLDDLLKQEQSVKRHKEQHCYVNVKPEVHSGSSTSSKCVSGRSTPTDILVRNGILSPTSPKAFGAQCYANLGSPTSAEDTDLSQGIEPKMNYAVLDLDKKESSSIVTVSTPVSAPLNGDSLISSPIRTLEGYAQIDFDKTVALSNSAIPCPLVDDSIRKTRHNAVIPCASMSA